MANTVKRSLAIILSVVAGTASAMASLDSEPEILRMEVKGVPFNAVLVKGGPQGDFYIGEYEVTQELWQAVMGNNPSGNKGEKYSKDAGYRPDAAAAGSSAFLKLPVERVRPEDAESFNARIGDLIGMNFRLPTEEEWEFAAKGGQKSRGYIYSGSDKATDVAWFYVNADGRTHEVGGLKPNELGLYDMSGNVWEWTSGKKSGYRILKGGSWCGGARSCRPDYSSYDGPDAKVMINGFRFVIDPSGKLAAGNQASSRQQKPRQDPEFRPFVPDPATPVFHSTRSEILVEAEAFADKGGWQVDQQFMDVMGSPYLIAHGLGAKVRDAVTEVEIPKAGEWSVWSRTYNWTAPFCDRPGPGRYMVSVQGQELRDTLGAEGTQWCWQKAGTLKLKKGTAEIRLSDLTGFDGRVDAIYLRRCEGGKGTAEVQPDDPETLRLRLDPSFDTPRSAGNFDFVVVGAGYSGICAAVSAARRGLKVALIGDRPVLGGNNSSEIRVQMGGSIECEPYPNLGNLLKEFAPTRNGNAMPEIYYRDDLKMQLVRAEPNISLFTSVHVCTVRKDSRRISSVEGRNIETGELLSFRAPLFADCTGDGSVGALAGASFRVGREACDEYGERDAVPKADSRVLGSSIQWSSRKDATPSVFPEFDWGISFDDSNVQYVTKGSWTWETGMNRDPIREAEQVRDYGMLVIYANWSYLKNHSPRMSDYQNRSLEWMAYIMGKRESRRLLGEIVLTQNDIEENAIFPDATCTTSWTIDLHFPDPENSAQFPGKEFKSICIQQEILLYPMPYRCFYSRDIDNLFMAGRDVSVSHVALGSVRVMRTCAMMGEVVGLAASVCHAHGSEPRSVYTQYFPELHALMCQGAGRADIQNNQLTNVGRNSHHYFITPEGGQSQGL